MADKEEKIKEESTLGLIFQIVGFVIWILGILIAAIMVMFGKEYIEVTLVVAIIYAFVVFVSGLWFVGFGEIICLLKSSYAVQKNSLNAINKKLDLLIQKEKK